MVQRTVPVLLALSVALVSAGCVPGVASEAVGRLLDGAIYVSASAPDNSGDGTMGNPYRNIRYVFDNNLALPGDTVRVLPGTYNLGMGESNFPINVPTGVKLIGDEATKGSATIVNDSGSQAGQTYAFTAAADTVIAGFTIHNPGLGINDHGVFVGANNVVLRSNTVQQMSGAGIQIQGGSGILIRDNFFDHNVVTSGSIGLAILAGAAIVVVENNTFSTNLYAVEAETTAVDFGTGTYGGSGGNVFSCNTAYDFYTGMGPGNIFNLPNNQWGPNPPQIFAPSSATVNTTPGISISPICS